jgi:hypothetical protein
MKAAKRSLLVLLAAVVMLLSTVARAELPQIGSFPLNGPPGMGDEFFIEPVVGDPALGTFTPDLYFGEESPPFVPGEEPTADTLMMAWGPDSPTAADFQGEAGWELVFGEDPDLRNVQISLSINPPGGIDVNGNFNGISSVSIVAIAVGNIVAGGWGFNTDQANPLNPPVDDPTAAGLVSLQNNAMHTVTINIGTGPVAGSATIVGPSGSVVGPNSLIGGNNDFANIISLQFFENGILQANVDLTAVIPGQVFPRLVNYWDHVTFTLPPPTVDIDIKPGSDPNSVNLKSKGVLPVAILTTAAFNALDVDPGTVSLAGIAPLRSTVEDVNADGNPDLLFHFRVPDLVPGVLNKTTTSLTLTGTQWDGVTFTATDSVRIPPGSSKGKK